MMNKMSNKMRAKLMKEEMGEKKMSPMGYAKKEKKESMKKEAMEQMGEMAGKKAMMAMKPSMMRRIPREKRMA
jgi:hypothetical protein